MIAGVWRFLIEKGLDKPTGISLFVMDSDWHSDAWTAVGLHRFLFLLYLGYRFGIGLHLAWCSWIIHPGVLAGYVNLTVPTY
jgi:hypothetical protein